MSHPNGAGIPVVMAPVQLLAERNEAGAFVLSIRQGASIMTMDLDQQGAQWLKDKLTDYLGQPSIAIARPR
jgi:hypothetical protein